MSPAGSGPGLGAGLEVSPVVGLGNALGVVSQVEA